MRTDVLHDQIGLRAALEQLPEAFVLRNATLAAPSASGAGPDGLTTLDIAVDRGCIVAVGRDLGSTAVQLDLRARMVLPCFVDVHTHLDKGHIWPRSPNPDGTFAAAIETVGADTRARWSASDVEQRMDFALRCAHAHGTVAIRTHLDSGPPQHQISWPVFSAIRERWAGRIALQAVSLVGGPAVLDREAVDLVARTTKAHGGIMGGVVADEADARERIKILVDAARRYDLELDLHIDETGNPASNSLRYLAEEVLAQHFERQVTAGHCCSLSRQDEAAADRTMDLVAQAGIHVVSLPMCNMYLQDRPAAGQSKRTPRWRGVTLVHELRARGVPVSIASDNTRDPFYAYGDLDGLEVLREGTRILHLDHWHGDWAGALGATPAAIMGLEAGLVGNGRAADLVITNARSWTELLARPQADRIVLRDGKPLAAPLPDYRELDELMGAC